LWGFVDVDLLYDGGPIGLKTANPNAEGYCLMKPLAAAAINRALKPCAKK
jgi:hypothetical protein